MRRGTSWASALRPRAHKVRRHLEVAGKILETLVKVHEADSGLGRGLGVLAIAGQSMDLLLGPEGPHQYFERHGYKVAATGALADIVRSRLDARGEPTQTVTFRDWSEIVEEYACGLASSRWPGSEGWYAQPLRARAGVDLNAVMAEVFWQEGSALEITEGVDGGAGSDRAQLRVMPLGPPGDYVAGPSIQAVASTLQAGVGGSLLLIGATGCGKSTFARHLAYHLARGQGRTLKINGSAVLRLDAVDILNLVRWAKPDVLLLDDIQSILGKEGRQEAARAEAAFLALLESLRGTASVMIGTVMVGVAQLKKMAALEPGSLSFGGIRPGRFDDVLVFPLPDEQERRVILAHYLGAAPVGPALFEDLVRGTEGLTGAYLRQLAAVVRQGRQAPQDALRRLRAMAPVEDEPSAAGPSKDSKPPAARP